MSRPPEAECNAHNGIRAGIATESRRRKGPTAIWWDIRGSLAGCARLHFGKRRAASSPSIDEKDALTRRLAESARTGTSDVVYERSSTLGSVCRRMSCSLRPRKEAIVCAIPSVHAKSTGTVSSEYPAKLFPSITIDAAGGQAAKASVAAHRCEPDGELAKAWSLTDTLPRYEVINSYKSASLGQSITRNTESGVDLGKGNGDMDEVSVPVKRKDPLHALPPEITSNILSFLDARSLAKAESVSKIWFGTASQRHAWRQAFQNETRAVRQIALIPTNGSSIQGLGLGNSSPDQDFKRMLQARRELQSKWRCGKAAAIYLEGHTDSVYCVQFDEYKIITGSRDQTVRVWDAKTYRCIKILGIPNGNSGNTRTLMPPENPGSPGRPSVVVICPAGDTPPSDLPIDFRHSGSILCLQFDENIMVTGSSDRSCIVWDLKADYQPFRRLVGHRAGVLDICFDHENIVSCSKDTTICIWRRETGERIRQLIGHRGPVNAVQLRGKLIVSASGDGVAKLWNLDSGLCIKEFASRDRGMACVDFSLDARTILAGGNDQVIYQFDTSSGFRTREMTGHTGLVRSLHLDNPNGRVVSGSYDTSVRAYDLATGNLIVEFVAWSTSWILSAKADYRRIVAASQDSRAVVMDFGHGVPGVELLAC